jgi:RNA polymerase sigma-32 factor
MKKKPTPIPDALEPKALEGEVVAVEREPSSISIADEPPLEDVSAIDVEALELGEEVESPTSEPAGLVRYDGLTAYLNEIRQYPKLSKEDETSLAIKYRDNKDLEAAYQLVSCNLWLVVKIARDYERAARSFLDLIQEGNIGLMEAVKNFDPYRGVRFPSYAVWWIKAYIIRYIIANWRLVKIGTTQAQRKLFFRLSKEKQQLEREGFSPAPKLLAERLQVKESDVIEMEQRLSGSDVSVDAPGSDDDGQSLLSILDSGSLTGEQLLAASEQAEHLSAAIKSFVATLTEKERIIFEGRLLSDEKQTLNEVADKLAISRERVRQIENRLKERLKKHLIENFKDDLADLTLLDKDHGTR